MTPRIITIAAAFTTLILAAAATNGAEAQATTGSDQLQTQDPAPFGLVWGASKADIEKLGVVLTATPDQTNGAQYVATKLPKIIADVQTVVLQLGFSGKLYRVAAVSRTYENDPYGTELRGRYDELVALLRQKYGLGKETDHTGQYYGDEKWSYGLFKNENWLYTDFKAGDVSIQIACRAVRMDEPYWLLAYESISGSALEDKARSDHEKGAL